MLLSSCLTFLHFETQVALLISKVSTRPCMEYIGVAAKAAVYLIQCRYTATIAEGPLVTCKVA